MTNLKTISKNFSKGLEKLGFDKNDDSLYLMVEPKELSDPQIGFHIEKAIEFGAAAVYLRKQLNGSYKPQAYLYDYTGEGFQENDLTEIQKVIWSSGEAPLACIFYDTEIKILDCTTHINDNNTPVYLINNLQIAGVAHRLYNEQFAIKIKGGIFWDEEENKKKFKFQNSSYDKLIQNIKYIVDSLRTKYSNISNVFINKIIVQAILIKYLEERIDDDGNKLLSNKFFKKYDKASTLNDVLRRGKFIDLLADLHDPKAGFNGNLFEWKKDETQQIKGIDLSILADLLESNITFTTGQIELWRYFEFKYIPVELISRLYEEFLGADKKNKGLYYTPSHLAKLLIDESIPLKKYNEINPENYRILDPACGSGIFLVIAFKRLVQIWRLQNGMARPEMSVLKKILLNIYGIDKEEQAVRLASFSLCLALCNELNPIDIINKLKFDDLTKSNIIQSDFFECENIIEKKFDVIIGNPPFVVGSLDKYNPFWEIQGEKVKIPQGQIALKFLSDSLPYLKEKGLQCLIIKSSGLLYNSTSAGYKKLLFSKLNVIQILDFTALARNKALWDNGADVGSAAIFIRNEKPDFKKNVLHVTFRRTKATKERIVFEIDDYDLHFVNRNTAIENQTIWKNNLLGGGRISSVVSKLKVKSFKDFLGQTNCIVGEGFKIGSKGNLHPNFIYEMPTMPTDAIGENSIDFEQIDKISPTLKFEKIPDEQIFTAPNLIIWENIGKTRIPIHLNKNTFSFQHKIIGISNKGNEDILHQIMQSFKEYNNFYRFFIYATSGQVLVNLNTAILKTDIMNIPFIERDNKIIFSQVNENIINDVNEYMQDFIRHGEGSKAVKQIRDSDFNLLINNYGKEFSNGLNVIYQDQIKAFRLSDVIKLDSSFIATVFKYDDKKVSTNIHQSITNFDLQGLSNHDLSKQLSINRIIKFYPSKDTIVFIKPNQYRYWLALIAYRDADKCFSDLTKLGY